MFKTEQDEMRVRTAIKNLIEHYAVHPTLAGLEKELPPGFLTLNKTGISIITEKVYELILLELNDKPTK